MATVDRALYNLETLPLEELRRLYESYFGHTTLLRGRETLCRTIAKKAVALHRPRPNSAGMNGVSQLQLEYNREKTMGGGGGSNKSHNNSSRLRNLRSNGRKAEHQPVQAGRGTKSVVQNYSPTRAGSAVAGSGFSASRLPGKTELKPPSMITTADGQLVPHYMLNNKESGSAWFERCVKEMGISTEAPKDLMDCRAKGRSGDGVVPWATKCGAMSNRMIQRYSGKLVKSNVKGTSTALVKKSDDEVNPSAERNQEVALAEWKLHRGVERGAVYLYHVWTGVKRSVLESECSGIYRILSPVMIESLLSQRKKLACKKKKLRLFNRNADSQVEAEFEDADEAVKAFEESGIEGAGGSGDFEEVPYCTIDIDHNNLLQMRIYFGKSQLNNALPQDAASPYAFRCEAACINEDKWFGLTGPWKNKVIFFSRDSDQIAKSAPQQGFGLGKGLVEAFFVDGFCFEKAYTENPCSVADPFQCTVCGSVRRGNNFIYADSGSVNLQRGRYFCAVCKKKVQHLSLSEESKKLRPRWDPTPARTHLEYSSLNDPPGK